MRDGKVLVVILLLILVAGTFYFYPVLEETNNFIENRQIVQVKKLNHTVQGPIQKRISAPQTFSLEHGGGDWLVTPKADYDIEALVMRNEHYVIDEWAWMAPYDLVLAWGHTAEEEYVNQISYTQSNRFYYYRYQKSDIINGRYVIDHTANTHIIPANPEIKDIMDKVKKGDTVHLKGQLVYIDVKYDNGRSRWWRTSLTRTDTGDGACEVFYVTDATIA